jgi:hypothetical protein
METTAATAFVTPITYRTYEHAWDLVPPKQSPRPLGKGERAFGTSVEDFLHVHPIAERDIKDLATAGALCPGAKVGVAGGIASAVVGGPIAAKVGVVAGTPFGPAGIVAGLCVGLVGGAVAGYVGGKWWYRDAKQTLVKKYVTNTAYQDWKRKMEDQLAEPRRPEMLRRLDWFILQQGIVPQTFLCSLTGNLVQIIAQDRENPSADAQPGAELGRVRLFDLSALENLHPDAQGRFQSGGMEFFPGTFFRDIAGYLVQKDAWRFRHRTLACLTLRDIAGLTPTQCDELRRLRQYCVEQEKDSVTRVNQILEDPAAPPSAESKLFKANVRQGLDRAELDADLYLSLGTTGESITTYLALPQVTQVQTG